MRARIRVATIALAAGLAAALGSAVLPGSTGTARADPITCSDSSLPVSLGPGQATDQQVFVRVCLPPGATPSTTQLLVHGCLYNGQYWDYPDPAGGSQRYSYVSQALKARYATVSVDMLGTGRSSHPPSALATVDAGVWVIHQVVQALRGGAITGPRGRVTFSKVIEVSWSFGTFFSWLEVSRYNDVDAAIFTSATHRLAVAAPILGDALALYPASQDPQFSGRYDPGYLTTQPGARGQIFYQPGPADPAVIAYDESHKDLMTSAEIAGFPAALAATLDIRVPVLLVMGSADPLFCGATATNCTSASALITQERAFLGPEVPRVAGYLVPGAGHAIDLMLNAGGWFAFAQDWAQSTVPPRAG